MKLDPRIHANLSHLMGLQAVTHGLSFLPKQAVASALNGRHASRIRWRGLHFEEMRQYVPGDDIKTIDWKAIARSATPQVRVFSEERNWPALLVVDQRMSMFFGARLNMKSVSAAKAAALTAFAVSHAGDRVGGIVFDGERCMQVTPRRSAGWWVPRPCQLSGPAGVNRW